MRRLCLAVWILLLTAPVEAQIQTFTTTIASTRVVCRFINDTAPWPRPTLIVLTSTADDAMSSNYLTLSDQLAAQHWFTMSIDLPAHGDDARAGESSPLVAWKERTLAQEPWIATFTDRLSAVLSGLIAGLYSVPTQIVLVGHSRGAFLAVHAAAVEPRIAGVAAVQPVTDLLRLTEWAGVTALVAGPLNLMALAPQLADRPTYLTIGTPDLRVGTDAAQALSWYVAGWGGPWTWQVYPDTAPGHGPPPVSVFDQVVIWIAAQGVP